MPMATAPAEARVAAARLSLADRLAVAAQRPVSAASSAVYRILFGLLGAYSAARFLHKGWVESLYLAPEYHLTYPWFTWVRPLPAPLMYAVVVAMIPLGLAIAVGYRTRLAAAAYLVVFVYCELIDAALYLNHYWYVTLALALVVVLPLSRTWSLDARAGRVRSSPWVPAAVVGLLRAQLAVVYVMAGLGKLNLDWLGRGEPMGTWLAARTNLPLVGPWLDDPWIGHVTSWAGAAFDLTIVGWLLWRRSRPFAYAAVVVFHVLTWRLFAIGVFPWVMIAGTLVFFPPDWPIALGRRLGRRTDGSASVVPATPPAAAAGGRRARWLVAGLAAWAFVELAIPLRHLAYAGDVRWTEEGYYGSFRVMLTEKTGSLDFRVTDPATGEIWTVEPGAVLTSWQANQAASRADLTLAAAHLVAEHFERRGIDDVQVRVDSFVSFNGRRRQRMIDPDVDLAALGRRARAAEYVLPLAPPVVD
jgi:vitamin K-dependent gamma-carboxylase